MISHYAGVFWDFDGVIKDSVSIKTAAYLKLFSFVSPELKNKIQNHHLKYGGMSRLKKIPLYLEWAELRTDKDCVEEYISNFAKLVVDLVVKSPWIVGAEQMIKSKKNYQKYFIVTGTPQDEIGVILERLQIDMYFDRIFGAPMEKSQAILLAIDEYKLLPNECLMIGDSESDWLASQETGIEFLLRSNGEDEFSRRWTGRMICNFQDFL
ncbi:HAD family hydrolase [Leptospira kanakyensis]|uniref:HAD family hydrolase n=1 Tax=Leptospira kanakyensis TaxID=2484968 RepID=UPI00223D1CDC|nr:HAD-IA family hydrolase [Leptospira kanakyensis]MCW7482131.1 HAD-IA family hydrolase [Leptospira kanakyensis]